MNPYLVRARIPGNGAPPGTIVIFLAAVANEAKAITAVEQLAPKHWLIEEVIGTATDALTARVKLSVGEVIQLGVS